MPASLHFRSGALRDAPIALDRPRTRIGRDAGLDVVVPPEDQRFVSRLHAVIVADGGGHVLEDCESTNGTWVNGRRVQRAALADGDEIQFGRHGPTARYRTAAAEVETVLAGGAPEQAPTRLAAEAAERPSQLVRRLVDEALARGGRGRRTRPVLVAGGALLVAALGAGGAVAWLGTTPPDPEANFRQLARDYEARVFLVEAGLRFRGEYVGLGHGTGFAAGDDGLIVTNKHVVHAHLYSAGMACVAESFRRRRMALEDSLVISVWPGGSQFRQTPTAPRGDRGLGYSSEHGMLELAAVAPANLLAPRTIQCDDFFDDRRFTMRWRPHAQDNNDLAVLRVSTPIQPIPLADSEPQPEDAVMVLGFPRGIAPLETNDAEPIRRTGRVLRVQETIQIDAVVLHGNSGGPLIDGNGRVVGITTRGAAETLNMAIKVEYAQRLLDRVRRTAPP